MSSGFIFFKTPYSKRLIKHMRYFQLNKNDILVLYHHSYLMQTTCSLNYMIQQYRNRSLCGMQDELNHIMSHYFTYSFLLIIWKDATRTITLSLLLLLLQLSLCVQFWIGIICTDFAKARFHCWKQVACQSCTRFII